MRGGKKHFYAFICERGPLRFGCCSSANINWHRYSTHPTGGSVRASVWCVLAQWNGMDVCTQALRPLPKVAHLNAPAYQWARTQTPTHWGALVRLPGCLGTFSFWGRALRRRTTANQDEQESHKHTHTNTHLYINNKQNISSRMCLKLNTAS